MKDSRQGQAFRRNVVYERNPCDCNCVLFDDEPTGDNSRRPTGRLDNSEAFGHGSFATERDPLASEIGKKKISVSGMTKRRTERQSTKKSVDEQLRTNKQTKVLIDLLQPATQQPEPPHPRSYKLNQTVQLPRPVLLINQPLPLYQDVARKLSFHPDRTATCTSQAQRHTASSHKSSSKQQLLSASFVLRQPHTNSFTHDVAFSQLSDNRYLSECSSIPRYRAVPQIVTTQVPQTVPEELTSRSNTVEVIVPPIPLRTEEKHKERRDSQRPYHGSQRQVGGNSTRGHVSARQSVAANRNIILREVESVNNHSPQAEDLEKLPMRFRHIQSIGQDLDIQRQDACSQVLDHYTPSIQLPIRKLLNRMSQPPGPQPPQDSAHHLSYSSRSRHENFSELSPGTARERLRRLSPSKQQR